MSAASNFPREMPRPWTPEDIARLVQQTMPEVSERMVHDMLRDPEAPDVPYFGKLGNARMFWEATVRAKLPEMLQWFAGATDRMLRRRAATMQADEARRRAALKTPLWSDPVADDRRAARVPEGFMAGDPPRKPKAPPSRIGKPLGGQ